jgi:hypothetical protein
MPLGKCKLCERDNQELQDNYLQNALIAEVPYYAPTDALPTNQTVEAVLQARNNSERMA